MFATVTYPYRDRETYEIHRTGDAVELTPERFAELSANGYVDAASPIDPMDRVDSVHEEPEGEGAGRRARARRRACSRAGGSGACARRAPGAGDDRAAAARRDRGEGRLRAEEGEQGAARRAFGGAVSEPFATLADYELRYGAVADGDAARVSALLSDASDMLLSAYESRFGAYAQGVRPAFDRSACSVACAVASRAMSAPLGLAGATQYSQTAGSYNASVTFANPTAELWLGRSDLKRLGLAGCRIGGIEAMTGADRG